jgi:hypothetical protein
MGHLVVPLKAVYTFWGQAANHPLPGDLAYADGSTIAAANQAINAGSSYLLPDFRNKFMVGADITGVAGDPGQYINFIVNTVSSANSYNYQFIDPPVSGTGPYVIGSTDYLIFDVYWPSGTIPATGIGMGSVGLVFTDNSGFGQGYAPIDQNGIGYAGDVRTYALNQWYTRRLSLSAMAGLTLFTATLANDYDGAFTNCTVRIRNIYIGNSDGTQPKFCIWMAGDGTPAYSTWIQSSSTFVSGNATTLTAPGPDGISGTNKRTLKIRHIPVHNHTASSGSAGDHIHTTSVGGHSSHTHALANGGNMSLVSGTAGFHTGATRYETGCVGSVTGSAGAHSHTVSPGVDGSHEHNITVSATGSGTSWDSRQRYLGTVWCVKSGLPTARLQSIPMGAIVMYYADVANEISPAGFTYCDGSSLTSGNHIVPNQSGSLAYTLVLPDTRNRYLIGADRTKAFGTAATANSDLPADAPGPGATGGTHVQSITSSNMPVHTHTGTSSGNPWSAHNHTFSITANASHTHGPAAFSLATTSSGLIDTAPSGGNQDSQMENDVTPASSTTSSTDGHSHTLSIGTTGSHSHTVTINSNGSGTTWDSRIPFIGIVYIMRTNIGLLSVPLKTVFAFRATTSNESIVPTDGTWKLLDGSTLTLRASSIWPQTLERTMSYRFP